MKPLKQVSDLIPYIPGKPVEELERELGISGSIKIASNENPIGPSKLAVDAVLKNINEVNRYPDGDCFYLKKKLADKLGVMESNLIIGNGSNEVIEILARTYLSENDEAIYGEHAFIVYPIVTQAIGAVHAVSPMPDLVHDLEDLATFLTTLRSNSTVHLGGRYPWQLNRSRRKAATRSTLSGWNSPIAATSTASTAT